jgi:hypothetical protein
MRDLILMNQIAKAAPTRERPGDVAAGYAKALEADLRKCIEGEVGRTTGKCRSASSLRGRSRMS